MKDKTKKIIQDHVQSHEYDIDPLEIWSGIEAKQKKRKGFFWITGLGILLLSLVIFLGIQYSPGNDKVTENKAENLLEITPTTTIATNNEPQPETNENLAKTSSSSAINKTKKNSDLPTSKLNNNTEKTSQSFNNIPVQKLNKEIQTTSNAQSIAQTNNDPRKDNTKRVTTNRSNNTDVGNKSNTSRIDSNLPSTLSEIKPDLTELETSIGKVRESMIALSTLKQNLNLFEVQQSQVKVTDSSIDSDFERFPWIGLEDQKKFRPLFSISALQSVAFYQKQTTSNQGVNPSYIEARNAAEMPLERFGSTLLMNVELTNWLTISTGVEYQKINEQFNWEGSYIIDENDNIIGPVPAVETLTEEDKVRIVERDMEIFNKHELVNVPIQLSLHHNFKSITYGAYGRASINVWNITEGASLDERLYPIDLASLQTQFMTQWSGGFFAEIPVFKSWKLQAAFGLNQTKAQETFTTNSYNFKEFTLGIKHQF